MKIKKGDMLEIELLHQGEKYLILNRQKEKRCYLHFIE